MLKFQLYKRSMLTVGEGDPGSPFFIIYDTEMKGWALILSLDCSTYSWFVPYNGEC